MLFNSHIFIFVFLPICLIGWYTINYFRLYKAATLFLIGMSLWFYGYFNPSYLLIITGSMLANFFFSFLMEKCSGMKKPVFILGLIANISLLGYFKYYDFFIENINSVFGSSFALKHILLPLGISFFTLQQISFLTDRYWGRAPHYKLLDYLAYVAFFPQLVAGPIVLHNEIIPQMQDLKNRKFCFESFKDGSILFIIGLAKKVIIADFFALMVNYGFEKILYLDTISSWLVALCYSFELYFDFSGYSDMACGLGLMFNFRLPANFNSPYKSLSVREFWKRWHITLSNFLTSYIYIPLGGNRKGKFFTILNTMIVFAISGFWHGASWTFVIWGLLHGIGVVLSGKASRNNAHKFPAKVLTFLFVTVAWAIFRSETIYNMTHILKAMFVPSYNQFMIDIGSTLSNVALFKFMLEGALHIPYSILYWVYLAILTVIIILTFFLIMGKNSQEILASKKEKGVSTSFVLFLGILFALSLVSMTGVSTFLYFNF